MTTSSIGSRSTPSRTQRENTPSAVDVGIVVDHSQESVSTALLKEFCQLTGLGHGRGHADRLLKSATRILAMSPAGRFRTQTSSDVSSHSEGLGIGAFAVIADDSFHNPWDAYFGEELRTLPTRV